MVIMQTCTYKIYITLYSVGIYINKNTNKQTKKRRRGNKAF